jgi:hypothetical protein
VARRPRGRLLRKLNYANGAKAGKRLKLKPAARWRRLADLDY